MQTDTPLRQLSRTVLKQDPVVWIGHMRAAGKTWGEIAHDLAHQTGVNVSRETVRLWAKEAQS